MDACHSVLPARKPVPRPSLRHLPHKLYSTLGHLIEILEELDSREEVSAVLRRIVADVDGADPANSSRSNVAVDANTVIWLSRILGTCNSSNWAVTMETENDGTNFTSSAKLTEVSGETSDRETARLEGAALAARTMSLSERDSLYLAKKVRDFEQRFKPLQEKNKQFLEKNMELTSRNRCLQEQIRNIADENRNMKETLDGARHECGELSRRLGEVTVEKGCLETQTQGLAALQGTVAEQEAVISGLRQACAVSCPHRETFW